MPKKIKSKSIKTWNFHSESENEDGAMDLEI